MFKRRKIKEGPPCGKLLQMMELVLCDLEKLADRVRKGLRLPEASAERPELGPIRIQQREQIFRTALHDGVLQYEFFHYTDFETMDPEAQVHLMQMFGDILLLNKEVAAGRKNPNDADLLEEIKSLINCCGGQATFFQAYADRFKLSTQIFERALSGADIARKVAKHEAADAKRLERLAAFAFDNEEAISSWPRPQVPFPLIVGKPFEIGQQEINGVYFDRDRAARVLAHLALQQSGENPAQQKSA